ncbi:MAG: helix-turn-helix domain-containing protein [Micropruina sp.]
MSTEAVSARRAATRERLMEAAIEVFAERGVLAGSVEDICERAGFTRGAFYSNFDSRDDLCLAVLGRQADQCLQATLAAVAVADAADDSTDVDRLIDAAVALFVTTQPSDPAWLIAHSELRLHAARNPALRDAFNELEDRVGAAISEVMGEALQRAGARLSVPLDQAVEMLHAIYEHSALTAVIQGRRSAEDVRTQQLTAVFRAMLVNPA